MSQKISLSKGFRIFLAILIVNSIFWVLPFTVHLIQNGIFYKHIIATALGAFGIYHLTLGVFKGYLINPFTSYNES